MGWLPIALALAGFMFFVFLVNSNSIKSHQEAIKIAFFNFCQTAKARHTLLRILNAPQEDCAAAYLESDFNFKKMQEYKGCIEKEKLSVEESRLSFQTNRPADAETRKIIKSIQVLNHRQHINIKVLNRKIKEYNTLISSYPTKMVARSTGQKVI